MPLLVVDLSNVPLSALAPALADVDFGGWHGINVYDPAGNQDAATKAWHINTVAATPINTLASATGSIDFSSYKGINVGYPTFLTDVASKQYHDNNKFTAAEAVSALAASTHRCQVRRTSDLDIADQTKVWISWQSEEVDVGDMVDLGTNPTRITASKTGFYFVIGKIYWWTNAGAGYVSSGIYKNRYKVVGVDKNITYITTAGDVAVEPLLAFIQMNAGDYLEIEVYQNTTPNEARKIYYPYTMFGVFLIA